MDPSTKTREDSAAALDSDRRNPAAAKNALSRGRIERATAENREGDKDAQAGDV